MIEIEPGFFIMKSRRAYKKYDIYIIYDGKYMYLLSFGDKRYQQFRDSTPEKLFQHKDHLDNKRRELYYKRHKTSNNKYSAKYWANKYLW